VLGIPDEIHTCVFGLDGMLTRTAQVHAAAWKEMFGGDLRAQAKPMSEPLVAFDPAAGVQAVRAGPPHAVVSSSASRCDAAIAADIVHDLAELLDQS
jgi:hypothetical protein